MTCMELWFVFFFKLLLYFDHISLICFKILRTVQIMKESINKYLIT